MLRSPARYHAAGAQDGDAAFLLPTIRRDHHDESENSSIIFDADAVSPIGELTGKVDEEGGLGRHLGLYSTTLLIASRMIGTGIFSTPSSIITGVGSVGAALLLWVLGIVISFCGLFVWLEFGSLFPRSGGEKVYLEVAYPRPRLLATTLFAINAVLLSNASGGCIVFAENLVLAFGSTATDAGKRTLAVLAIFCVTCMHAFIPRLGVKIMNTLAMIKIFILLFVVLTGLYVLTIGIETVPNPSASFTDLFSNASESSYDYTLALFKVVATYQGWSNAAYVLNEVKNPVKTLKVAGPLGLGTVGILYILANVAYFSVATPAEIGKSGVTVAALFMGKIFGEDARRIAAAFVSLSALGNVMTVSFSDARVDQELAKEGMLPFSHFWASNWPCGAPTASLFLMFMFTFAFIVVIPFGDAYNFILDVMGYPTALVAFAVTVGLFFLRKQAPILDRPFKVWLPLAFFFLAAQAFLIITPFIRPKDGKGDTSLPYWLAPLVGIFFMFGGMVVWAVWRVILPNWGGYLWIAHETHLRDGTPVVTWRKSKDRTPHRQYRYWWLSKHV